MECKGRGRVVDHLHEKHRSGHANCDQEVDNLDSMRHNAENFVMRDE